MPSLAGLKINCLRKRLVHSPGSGPDSGQSIRDIEEALRTMEGMCQQYVQNFLHHASRNPGPGPQAS